MSHVFPRLAAAAMLALVPALAEAQSSPALPLGSSAQGRFAAGQNVRYQFTARSAGVLTVAVKGSGDLVLTAMDADGQPLEDGTVDGDLRGDAGAEMLSVILPQADAYIVEVRAHGSAASEFTIGATFLPMAAFASEPDPDRRPSKAKTLTVGGAHEDQLHPGQGDLWDWYAVTVREATTLIVMTRTAAAVDGDLALDAFLGEDYSKPVVSSDQDLQGSLGHESVTVQVGAGQTARFRVRAVTPSGGPIPYRVSVGQMP